MWVVSQRNMVFSQEQLTFLILPGLVASCSEPESFNEMKTYARYLQLRQLGREVGREALVHG
jgi:hypothetical protein